MTDTITLKSTTLPIARDGAIGVSKIDNFVKTVATQPMNEEQMNKAVGDIICESMYTVGNIKKIIADRRTAGRYDDILNERIDPRARASTRRNLARIGIEQ